MKSEKDAFKKIKNKTLPPPHIFANEDENLNTKVMWSRISLSFYSINKKIQINIQRDYLREKSSKNLPIHH